MKYYITPPPMNPVSRLVTAVIAVLVLTAAFFFGLVVLAVLVMAFSVFALIIYLRSRWYGRSARVAEVDREATRSSGSVIDAEYTVVSRQINSRDSNRVNRP
jgi:uncharacterized protein (DUF58 family)